MTCPTGKARCILPYTDNFRSYEPLEPGNNAHRHLIALEALRNTDKATPAIGGGRRQGSGSHLGPSESSMERWHYRGTQYQNAEDWSFARPCQLLEDFCRRQVVFCCPQYEFSNEVPQICRNRVRYGTLRRGHNSIMVEPRMLCATVLADLPWSVAFSALLTASMGTGQSLVHLYGCLPFWRYLDMAGVVNQSSAPLQLCIVMHVSLQGEAGGT
jgi:hypothetical protein